MSISAKFPRIPAALVGVVTLAIAGCTRPIAITPAAPPTTLTTANPCGNVGPQTFDTMTHRLDVDVRTRLIANGYCNYFIPEYHDEQRLSNGGSDYGPITYSYAYQVAGAHQDHTPFDNAWVNVAIIEVGAGTLYSTYRALKLETGPNCLFLKHEHEPGGKERWRAVIAPPENGIHCASVNEASRVPMVAEPPVAVGTIPPVTRFEEGVGRAPRVGVKCGNQWCIVGVADGNGVLPPAFAGLPGAGTSSRWTVRGWFDDQTLGVTGSGGNFGIRPRVKYAIVPDDNLGNQTVQTFIDATTNNSWVPVARILIPEGAQIPAKYAGQNPGYALRPKMNTLWIRATVSGADTIWTAKVSYETGGEYIYPRPVRWRDHRSYGIPVPATARWRWDDRDEEIWVRCDVGCCMIEGGFQ